MTSFQRYFLALLVAIISLCAPAAQAVTPRIATGSAHTLALKDDGTVWSWGYNFNGQLGNGSTAQSLSPVQVTALAGMTAIAAGQLHSLALKNDGTVWAWGTNLNGQLGNGTNIDSNTPTQVIGLTGAIAIAAGASHTVALKSDGTVWAWGSNAYGQLGNGSITSYRSPVQVTGLAGVTAIAVGANHTIALKSDGTVWTWGYNSNGQLGVNNNNALSTSPVQAIGLGSVTAIAGGTTHTVALKSDGTVWAWGFIGFNSVGTQSPVPVQVPGTSGVVSITAGTYHVGAIKTDGTGLTWGYNSSGQLGNGTTVQAITPVQVSSLSQANAISATGATHTVTIKNDGTVWAWGSNAYGQLGDGSTTQANAPVQVRGASGSGFLNLGTAVLTPPQCSLSASPTTIAAGATSTLTASCNPAATSYIWTNTGFAATAASGSVAPAVTTTYSVMGSNAAGNGNSASVTVSIAVAVAPRIASGSAHTVALKDNGTVWAWGNNSSGQLGNGTTTASTTPGQVSSLTNMTAIAAGQLHTAALKSDGTVWTWGSNAYGQLGNASNTQATLPVQVVSAANMTAITAGASHTVALKNDGTVWAWGSNAYGQLGNSTVINSTVPVQVTGLAGVTAIAAGANHTIALKSDGTVWTWGYNSNGQLGVNNNNALSTSPVQAIGLGSVTAIAGGTTHTVALKSDGTVWAWGFIGFNSVGTQSPVPVQVAGLSSVKAITAGIYHVAVLKTDGTVWTWGYNADGQLGLGTTVQAIFPVQVPGLTGVSAIAASGAAHTVILKSDGTVWAWGNNASGQLGDGSTTQASSPVQTKGAGGSGVLNIGVPPPPPQCTLTATPSTIVSGTPVTLTASCTPAATSYAWTNSGFGSTVASGTVTPLSTTTYSVVGSNSVGAGNTAIAIVTANPLAATAQALFVNASTSTNKTSVVRIINTSGSTGGLIALAYNESGQVVGTVNASLGTIGANQTRTFSSAELESAIGFTPSSPTAKYLIYFGTSAASFQIINYTKDIATGALTLSQSLYTDRSNSVATSVTRSAWFMSASTSTNKSNVLRILNTSSQNGSLSASLYDENGNLIGAGNTSLGTIAAHQMLSYTSAQLEAAMGYSPPSPTGKYRVVFTANLPSMELINFTKDLATGNLALVQAQVDDRPASSAMSSVRNVLLVYPSTNTQNNTTLRIINPNSTSATVTAVAYDEAGSVVGSGTLGVLAANQILALTSAQIETALGYSAGASTARYRLVVNADVPTFEVINDSKVLSNGNLYLAQAQTDNRAASSATSTTRNAYVIYASGNSLNTTELRVINTTGNSGTLTATAYDDSGALLGTNVTLASLGPYQMLSFTSAQLQTLFGYTPPGTATTWRIVLNADLGNFEVLNYAKDVGTGTLTLAQPQTE